MKHTHLRSHLDRCKDCGHEPTRRKPTGLPSGWTSTIATNALIAWRPRLGDCAWLGVNLANGIKENA